jgi:hypothetical protein
MTSFSEQFHCTDGVSSAVPAIATIAADLDPLPSVGTYQDGLLSILDNAAAPMLLNDWPMRDRWLPLIATGMGDLFFWDQDSPSVYFLNVQHGTTEFVDAEVPWLLDQFLIIPEILEKVFRKSRIEALTALFRPLRYGEAFIREPWAMFGGPDRDEFYSIGQLDVYLSLVGQTQTKAAR